LIASRREEICGEMRWSWLNLVEVVEEVEEVEGV
jgi:hypothetical protein